MEVEFDQRVLGLSFTQILWVCIARWASLPVLCCYTICYYFHSLKQLLRCLHPRLYIHMAIFRIFNFGVIYIYICVGEHHAIYYYGIQIMSFKYQVFSWIFCWKRDSVVFLFFSQFCLFLCIAFVFSFYHIE